MNPTDNKASLEIVAPTALEAQERAQVDIQISTARRYPRILSVVKKTMLEFATLDEETAQSCFYVLPARKGGDGKSIIGPSARLAEIALASYGHISAGARIIENDGKFLTAQGVCHDLQTNVRISVEVKRRITNKYGERFSDDMVVVTGNAACSIALRNAIFKVVPMALIKPCFDAARKTAVGDAKTLATRRADAIKTFAQMGIAKERVLAQIDAKALEDITLEKLETLIGLFNAIKEGDTSIDEAFPSATAKDAPPPPSALPGKGEKKSTQGGTVPGEPHSLADGGSIPSPAPIDRDTVISRIKNDASDLGMSEEAAAQLVAQKDWPEGITALWELPTATLAKLHEKLARMMADKSKGKK